MEAQIYDLSFRALISQEGEEFVAHALETDLLGYGKTEAAAIKELHELILCQISFARQKKEDSLLIFPAAKEYFERWENAHEAALRKEILEERSVRGNARAIFISFTRAEMRQVFRRRFRPVAAMECA